jgi:pseudouridine-5'-phosphate glycosidase
VISPDVAAAFRTARPIVAVESSIIDRSLPYPQCMSLLLTIETSIRAKGVEPAVIAVIKGAIRVGLSQEDKHAIATADDAKISYPGLACAVGLGKTGVTTVSSSIAICNLVSIPVFVTGAIGGVHRNFHTNLDISPDLMELSRRKVAVVCSGAKAVLDIPNTIEYLETIGVPIVGYRTDSFPAYYTDSGIPVDCRVEAAREIARILRARWMLGSDGAVLVVQQPPSGKQLDADRLEALIGTTLADAAARGIRGKALTPFLLRTLTDKTSGESKSTSADAILANAELAADVAIEFMELLP